jgi:Flp pilus assembly protein TadG
MPLEAVKDGSGVDVTMDLFHIVEQAHSLERILDAASRVVAERLRVDGCFVFLLDEHGDLVRADAAGSSPSGPLG